MALCRQALKGFGGACTPLAVRPRPPAGTAHTMSVAPVAPTAQSHRYVRRAMSRTALGATASLRMAAHAAAPARGAHRVPSARSRHPLRVCAMVNVDFASPSLVLGTALIGCGIVLLQARNMRQRVSRDADIVVAAMISIVGSTLIFQGWRLDPLLLLCQALTTSVAFWYGMETFKLRGQLASEEQKPLPSQQLQPPQGYYTQQQAEQQQMYQAGQPGGPSRSFLPPGERPMAPWQQPLSVQQEEAMQVDGYAASSTAPQWGQEAAGGPYESMIRYDYYGQPQEPMVGAGAPGAEQEGRAAPDTYSPASASNWYGGGAAAADAYGSPYGGAAAAPSGQGWDGQAAGGGGYYSEPAPYADQQYGAGYEQGGAGAGGVAAQPQQPQLPPSQQQQRRRPDAAPAPRKFTDETADWE